MQPVRINGKAGGMKRPTIGQIILWLLLALPMAGMLYAWRTQPEYTYGAIVGHTGLWSAWLMIATLAVTPIRLVFARAKWPAWLVRRRRDLGVATFAYAAGHTLIYLFRKKDFGLIVSEGLEPWLAAGWVALAVFAALAVTSNDWGVRALGRRWKALHRFVYLAAILTFVHWVLSAFEPRNAYMHLAVLAALETVRIVLQFRRRRRT